MAEFSGGSPRDSKEASLSGSLWSISIILGADRSGVLSFEYNGRMLDYPVLGRSEYDRSPLERYGHTPTGTYSIPKILITGPGTKLGDKKTGTGLLTYGHEGAIVLQPEGGEALDAFHKGRRVFLIHAGDLNREKAMRPTHGCIRMRAGDMRDLISKIMSIQDRDGVYRPTCVIRSGETLAVARSPSARYSEDYPLDDPPTDGSVRRDYGRYPRGPWQDVGSFPWPGPSPQPLTESDPSPDWVRSRNPPSVPQNPLDPPRSETQPPDTREPIPDPEARPRTRDHGHPLFEGTDPPPPAPMRRPPPEAPRPPPIPPQDFRYVALGVLFIAGALGFAIWATRKGPP
jgi:L,D-transpeptidase-like protein